MKKIKNMGGINMNPLNIGVPSLILILLLALIIFGPKRLPEMGRAFGQTLGEFKKSTKGIMDDETGPTKAIENKENKS